MRQPSPKPKSKPEEEVERPDVEVHDDIYFRHEKGPVTGKVKAVGKHGCTVIVGADEHKVRWENVLGHKLKISPDMKIVDQGEDGFIAQDAAGRRRYVHDPVGVKPPEQPLAKALNQPRLLLFAPREDLMKALGPTKGRPGLSLQSVTDKGGNQTKRWKKTGGKEPPKGPGGPAQPEHEPAGSKQGYGIHNLEAGDKVDFKAGDFAGSGEIVGEPGSTGAHVRDSSGRDHQVRWSEITGHTSPKGAKEPKADPSPKPEHEKIPPEKFSAHDFAGEHDDKDASVESILSHFPPDTAKKIADNVERLKSIEETIDRHKSAGEYKTERQALHRKILFEGVTIKGKFHPGIFSTERVAAATPAPGEKPTFMMLGGRGGSGKSAFDGEKFPDAKVYDPAKAIVLDSDEIKKLMPEYEGWNAAQVHEESSEIFKNATSFAESLGLNIVQDATMATPAKAVAVAQRFKDSGYRIEAHYMHLPRQEAARRAVDRFLGKTQRFVPPAVVLANTDNEKAFDGVRKIAHKWSFRDNNVPEGTAPKLISEGENKFGED